MVHRLNIWDLDSEEVEDRRTQLDRMRYGMDMRKRNDRLFDIGLRYKQYRYGRRLPLPGLETDRIRVLAQHPEIARRLLAYTEAREADNWKRLDQVRSEELDALNAWSIGEYHGVPM